jgi:hypothetical protein
MRHTPGCIILKFLLLFKPKTSLNIITLKRTYLTAMLTFTLISNALRNILSEITQTLRSPLYLKVKAQRLSWFGHLHRMSEERMVKEVYKWKPMLRRPLGRPKNRWEDDIRNDMKKLKIRNWTNCIQDRNNWKLYVEKAKTFKD